MSSGTVPPLPSGYIFPADDTYIQIVGAWMERRMISMRKLTILIVLLSLTDVAWARPDVRTMNCAQARALVWQSGAIVLTTGRYTYDRYVAGQRYCYRPYYIRRAWVATADTDRCLIGYTCEQRVFRRLFERDD